eukprot:234669-Pleurochrysis_carterae.AAC.2
MPLGSWRMADRISNLGSLARLSPISFKYYNNCFGYDSTGVSCWSEIALWECCGIASCYDGKSSVFAPLVRAGLAQQR